jgi:hypothetical protein
MRTLLKATGLIIYFGAGVVLWFSYFAFMRDWLGILGGILAVFIPPGIVLFPLVVWYQTGAFPVYYFVLLIGGIVLGSIFFALGSIREKS